MKKGSTLRIGIIGVGHLGYFHLKQIITISNIEISGIYDNNKKRAEEVSSEYDVKSFSILNDLLISSEKFKKCDPRPLL